MVEVQVGCGTNIGLWKLNSVSKVTLWKNVWLQLWHWLYKQLFTIFFFISFWLLCLYVNAHTLALYSFIFELLLKLVMITHSVHLSPSSPTFCWVGRGWASNQIFNKRGGVCVWLDRISIFRVGLLGRQEWIYVFFWGGGGGGGEVQFWHKKLKSEINKIKNVSLWHN